MKIPFGTIHPTDESGPTMPEPRVQHFTSPKSKDVGLRKAFGTYAAPTPIMGVPSPTGPAPYFNSVRNLFGNGGLTRVLKSGNNRTVF